METKNLNDIHNIAIKYLHLAVSLTMAQSDESLNLPLRILREKLKTLTDKKVFFTGAFHNVCLLFTN